MKSRFDIEAWLTHVNNFENYKKNSPESNQAVEYFTNHAKEIYREVVRLSFCLYKCHSFLQTISTSFNDKFSYFFNNISQNEEIPSLNALGKINEDDKKNLNEFNKFLDGDKIFTRKK